jgi:hypothetical protein
VTATMICVSGGQSEQIDKQSLSFKEFSYDSLRCVLHTASYTNVFFAARSKD